MKIKTSELSGVALDFATAKAIGAPITTRSGGMISDGAILLMAPCGNKVWSPSTDWSQCGSLIERFSLEIVSTGDSGWHAVKDWYMGEQLAWFPKGDTILIAACRAIVAAKLGDEIDVPEGLV